jgi:hypothetical protein
MLSIIVPTIRTDKWRQLYDSIRRSTAYDFELILIGPTYSSELSQYSNVRFIQDFGSPVRAQQIGFCNATQKYVFGAADDCIFEVEALDKCMEILENGETVFDVVVAKYSEGGPELQNDDYYLLNKAYPPARYINGDWVIFNCAMLHRQYLEFLGGFDCQLQIPAFGYADLAARCQRHLQCVGFNTGQKNFIKWFEGKLLHCEHGQLDHGPIEQSHVFEDTPLYQHLHNNQPDRISVRMDNWKKIKPVWGKR